VGTQRNMRRGHLDPFFDKTWIRELRFSGSLKLGLDCEVEGVVGIVKLRVWYVL
jgi:hypothetical protein